MNDELKDTLLELARKAWDANIKEDADFYAQLLTDDAVGITGFGVMDKVTLVEQMRQHSGIPFTKVDMTEPRLIVLTPDSALLTYKATIHALKDGQELILSDYVTTAFVRRDGEWKGALQQHSRIQTATT